MKVVSNWRSVWRSHSAQALAAITALPLVWMELPADVKALLPDEWYPYVLVGVALGGLIGRLRDQGLNK